MATNRERILQFIRDFPGRDDDSISLSLRILPRQSVNIACRELERRGQIVRKRGVTGKISNFPLLSTDPPVVPSRRRAEPDVEGEQVLAPVLRTNLTAGVLREAGFAHSGQWRIAPSKMLEADRPLPKQPGVYSFVIGDVAYYVGVAMMGLAKRLHFYARPGCTQKTSQRLNRQLIHELATGKVVEIYTAQPPDLTWNGLPVSGAAGLEVGLIKGFHLPWNIRGS